MLFAGRKLSPSSARRLDVSRVGSLGGVEHSEMHRPSINSNPRDEPLTVRLNAFDTEPIVATRADVGVVLRLGGVAEIGPAIIQPVAISVIDFDRIEAGHKLKDQAVRLVANTIKFARPPVPVAGDLAEQASRALGVESRVDVRTTEMSARSFAPSQRPAFQIVIEALAQIFTGWQRTRVHWFLRLGSVCHPVC